MGSFVASIDVKLCHMNNILTVVKIQISLFYIALTQFGMWVGRVGGGICSFFNVFVGGGGEFTTLTNISVAHVHRSTKAKANVYIKDLT